MKPLFLKLHTGREIMVLPDTQAHVDGHPIITQSYAIFRNDGRMANVSRKAAEMLLEPLHDPDYLGLLRFGIPDKLFEYRAPEHATLESEEVSEVIGQLSHLRAHPHLWELDR